MSLPTTLIIGSIVAIIVSSIIGMVMATNTMNQEMKHPFQTPQLPTGALVAYTVAGLSTLTLVLGIVLLVVGGATKTTAVQQF